MMNFEIGDVILDPFYIGRYGRGGAIVTKVVPRERYGEPNVLLEVIYLNACSDDKSFTTETTRGIDSTNVGITWGSTVQVKFNSKVSLNVKSIKIKEITPTKVTFEEIY